MYGQPLLPEDPKGIAIRDNLRLVPIDETGNPIDEAVNEVPVSTFQPYGWWDTAWKWTKCVAAVALAFTPA